MSRASAATPLPVVPVRAPAAFLLLWVALTAPLLAGAAGASPDSRTLPAATPSLSEPQGWGGGAPLLAQADVPPLTSAPLAPPGEAPPTGPARDDGIDLLRLADAPDYRTWMQREGWKDRRPFSDSGKRFRVQEGVLRLESQGDSFLIGRELPPALARPIADYPFLRFVVRIAEAPQGARLRGEAADDSAFRIYAIFASDPLQALAYVWSEDLAIGEWSARGRSLLGDFRGVRRKSFGRGEPMGEVWLTVEVNLARDYGTQFPGAPLPVLRGLALKSDSNDVPRQRSLAWLRAVTLHRTSLAGAGLKEWDSYRGTVLLFR